MFESTVPSAENEGAPLPPQDTSQTASASPTPAEAIPFPHHVAIIMDGNGRWAKRRHVPRLAGHRAGVETIRRVLEVASETGVTMLSIYAFSTENWGRSEEEVRGLMGLFWEVIKRELDDLNKNGVKLRHVGREEGLSADLIEQIHYAVDVTKQNTRIELNVCFNYGGRGEIADAVKRIIRDGIPAEQITEELLSKYMYTGGLPDPDMVIRTASEMRLSNFLIWQTAYSEYYATETLWPDFGKDDFKRALDVFSQRQRRFGKR